MYVIEVSTWKVQKVTQVLRCLEVTSAQISRATAELDKQLSVWSERPTGRMLYLLPDARYKKVRHGGSVVSCAVLGPSEVSSEGGRCVLGVSVKLSEAQIHRREFLPSQKERELYGVQLVLRDDRQGLQKARRTIFLNVAWQRNQFPLKRKAAAYAP